MRVVVSADDSRGLDSFVSAHFGRCPYYILADVEGKAIRMVQAVANPFYSRHQPGQVPGFVQALGANVMITGGMGDRAVALFDKYGIEPVTGAAGTVQQALEQYLGGRLRGAAPCAGGTSHGHGEIPAPDGDGQGEARRLREQEAALQQRLNSVAERLNRLRRK